MPSLHEQTRTNPRESSGCFHCLLSPLRYECFPCVLWTVSIYKLHLTLLFWTPTSLSIFRDNILSVLYAEKYKKERKAKPGLVTRICNASISESWGKRVNVNCTVTRKCAAYYTDVSSQRHANFSWIHLFCLRPPRSWACKTGKHPKQQKYLFSGWDLDDSIRLLNIPELFLNSEGNSSKSPLGRWVEGSRTTEHGQTAGAGREFRDSLLWRTEVGKYPAPTPSSESSSQCPYLQTAVS